MDVVQFNRGSRSKTTPTIKTATVVHIEEHSVVKAIETSFRKNTIGEDTLRKLLINVVELFSRNCCTLYEMKSELGGMSCDLACGSGMSHDSWSLLIFLLCGGWH